MESGCARERYLVETDWLAAHLDALDIAVLDASWYLPSMNREALAEYEEAHIPGALFFDIDTESDPVSDLPHMLPDPMRFSARVRRMGIGDGQKIVVYDGAGLFSAARVWWMFRVMGVPDVAILNGGFPKWRSENRPVETGQVRRRGSHFSARLASSTVCNADDVEHALSSGRALVLDARATARFRGEIDEPRPGVRTGHMPGSQNLPFDRLLADDGRVLDNAALRTIFEGAGWRPGQAVITSCGSGVTAAVVTFALALLGEPLGGLYDGSWAEWGADTNRPVATDDV